MIVAIIDLNAFHNPIIKKANLEYLHCVRVEYTLFF